MAGFEECAGVCELNCLCSCQQCGGRLHRMGEESGGLSGFRKGQEQDLMPLSSWKDWPRRQVLQLETGPEPLCLKASVRKAQET